MMSTGEPIGAEHVEPQHSDTPYQLVIGQNNNGHGDGECETGDFERRYDAEMNRFGTTATPALSRDRGVNNFSATADAAGGRDFLPSAGAASNNDTHLLGVDGFSISRGSPPDDAQHPIYKYFPKWTAKCSPPKPENSTVLSAVDESLWKEFSDAITHELKMEYVHEAMLAFVMFAFAFAITWPANDSAEVCKEMYPNGGHHGRYGCRIRWWEESEYALWWFGALITGFICFPFVMLNCIPGMDMKGVERTIEKIQGHFAERNVRVELVIYEVEGRTGRSRHSCRYIVFTDQLPQRLPLNIV
mmetsp:Transcript_27507/g.58103  ORF Transcript_27507/g.58103 Transcript_27507/m.58103 type:complete len:302 (+) Transcript_27507:15-920(+)